MTERRPRMTTPTVLILRELVADPTLGRYGLDLSEAAGVGTGTVYPILVRLEQAGWVVSEWETVNPSEEGRPRRRYYKLSEDGAEQAVTALARIDARTRHGRLSPRPEGGAA